MKRIVSSLAILLALASCRQAPEAEQKVMARHVPERADDFIFENNLICGRIYGQALEGNPTSPGIDIWVKIPGALVADQRYKDELENGKTYHKDWGNGKDCYKVAVSLGGGASAPLVDGALCYPATNWRSYEILSQTPDEIVFVLKYPSWDAGGYKVALEKKITVSADSYFCKVEDTYKGEWEGDLTIAAGVIRHDVVEDIAEDDRVAIWEHASDQSVEPEDGMIGVAVCMPEADAVMKADEATGHALVCKNIRPDETVTYWFGSCWSKGDLKTSKAWFDLVETL